jgi:hypothetical protein
MIVLALRLSFSCANKTVRAAITLNPAIASFPASIAFIILNKQAYCSLSTLVNSAQKLPAYIPNKGELSEHKAA